MVVKIGRNNICDSSQLTRIIDGIPESCHVAQAMSDPEILQEQKSGIVESLVKRSLSPKMNLYYKDLLRNLEFYEEHPGERGLRLKGIDIDKIKEDRPFLIDEIEYQNKIYQQNKESCPVTKLANAISSMMGVSPNSTNNMSNEVSVALENKQDNVIPFPKR